MRSGWTKLLVFAGVLAFLVLSGAAIAGAASNASLSDEWLLQTDIDDADSVEMDVTVHPDGDAEWEVVYRLELDSEEEIEAFETVQADIEADQSTYLDPFEDRIQRTVESAESTTQREMSAQDFSVSAQRTVQPNAEFGEVVYRFQWTGFATVEDDGSTIRAGDALDSLFLEDRTSLTLRWQEGYHLDSHTPQAGTERDQRLTWRGPLDFDSGEPRLTLTADGETFGADVLPSTPALMAGILVAGVVVALWLVGQQRRQEPVADEKHPGQPPDESAASSEGDGTPAGVPSDLLSNEERVLALLEQHDGRLKQKRVAETLDWSAAKTSQVVGTLRDEGDVESFRIGRENVLTLPDVGLVNDRHDDATDDPDADEGS